MNKCYEIGVYVNYCGILMDGEPLSRDWVEKFQDCLIVSSVGDIGMRLVDGNKIFLYYLSGDPFLPSDSRSVRIDCLRIYLLIFGHNVGLDFTRLLKYIYSNPYCKVYCHRRKLYE